MNLFKGLTCDHPRGYRPLQAWASADDALHVQWDIQTLEGFESHAIAALAENYDLLIVDNPGIGEAVEQRCLRPLEAFLTQEAIAYLRQTSTGGSFASYRYGDQHWAIPVDAAAQVCALAGNTTDAPPETWLDVVRLSQQLPGRTALSPGGPHALLTWYSLCQSLGGKLFAGDDFILDSGTAIEALRMMQAIYRHQDKHLTALNPIGLLDAMAKGTCDVCPAIFGYVNYSSPNTGRAVKFFDIPHCGDPALRGSVLGGTGLAVSVRCQPTPALVRHLMTYVSEQVQKTHVVEHGGQPANRYAWQDERANALTNGFFADTLATVSQAYLRPHYHGYIAFQDSSSAILRHGLMQQTSAEAIYLAIKDNHTKHR
ncbi:hypothetical protein JZM24_13480 [Candidatus Sodalis endolongispinus]|uniref:Uncharacterized protein n=1 Tax=Candidatus Sodalis endolongispinus TaxID=2812662 RepID=A0ABS5YD29_9GAMM|nr:hypothetical protein [Candidatus Sodalis endolongispinus]MBT9432893.1 hypothetical protein [Candidatus Sodalis endolongispinus]